MGNRENILFQRISDFLFNLRWKYRKIRKCVGIKYFQILIAKNGKIRENIILTKNSW